MKPMRFPLLPMLCVALLLLSCSKDNNPSTPDGDNNNTPSTGTPFIRFTIDGPGLQNRTIESGQTAYSTNYIYYEAEGQSAGSFIAPAIVATLTFPGRATGTYQLGEDSIIGLSITDEDDNSTTSLTSAGGTLVITEANPQTGVLRGTFSGTFMSMDLSNYTITNGSFSIRKK